MGFRILILLLISVHAISARPQSEEESDDAGEEWKVECGLHNKNEIEGGSPKGGLISDFFVIGSNLKKKGSQITLLSIFSVIYSALDSDLAPIFGDLSQSENLFEIKPSIKEFPPKKGNGLMLVSFSTMKKSLEVHL